MSAILVLLAALFVGLAATHPPPSALPDLAACRLAHGFVIGEAPAFPGTVGIWQCAGRTIVLLNEMQGEGPDRKAQPRSHFSPDPRQGEQLMGCRGNDENYAGIVALARNAGTPRQELRRAWKADLEKWEFVDTSPQGIVCNRGLSVD